MAVGGLRELFEVFVPRVLPREGVVLLWAGWCRAGRLVKPIFDEFSLNRSDSVTFQTVNVEEDPLAVKLFGCLMIPAVLIVQNAEVVERLQGVQSEDQFRAWLDTHCNGNGSESHP